MREVIGKKIQRSGDGFDVAVDCPFCGKEHRHGNVRDGEHRVSHCTISDVPDHDGYVIRIRAEVK